MPTEAKVGAGLVTRTSKGPCWLAPPRLLSPLSHHLAEAAFFEVGGDAPGLVAVSNTAASMISLHALDASFGSTKMSCYEGSLKQMTRLTRHLLAIGVVIFPAFLPTSNSAIAGCTSSGDCPLPLQCLPGLFEGFCALTRCNSDSDCRNGSLCATGFCLTACRRNSDCHHGEVCADRVCQQVATPTPTPPPPPPPQTPTRYYIEGGLCGTIPVGGPHSGVVKHVGCAPGLQCVGILPNGTGTCQRPPS
jgi:hypothetical protein